MVNSLGVHRLADQTLDQTLVASFSPLGSIRSPTFFSPLSTWELVR